MAKKNKTKIHKVVDGQLLQMNKSFRELKQKQKDKIINWIYEEYKNYVSENGSVPGEQGDAHIMSAVLDKIAQAGTRKVVLKGLLRRGKHGLFQLLLRNL
jgi:hypothetical protein